MFNTLTSNNIKVQMYKNDKNLMYSTIQNISSQENEKKNN